MTCKSSRSVGDNEEEPERQMETAEGGTGAAANGEQRSARRGAAEKSAQRHGRRVPRRQRDRRVAACEKQPDTSQGLIEQGYKTKQSDAQREGLVRARGQERESSSSSKQDQRGYRVSTCRQTPTPRSRPLHARTQ